MHRGIPVLPVLGVLAVLALPAGPTASAAPTDLAVSDPAPAPGAVVAAGETVLHARVHGPHPITAARFTVDTEPPVHAQVDAHDPTLGTPVRVPVALAPGAHAVRVEAEDAEGRRVDRTWWVTATERSVRRHAGRSRVDTAVAVSAAAYPDAGRAPAAVLARADAFPDALAGVPMAVAVDGPLLLARSDELPAATADELRRVLEPGAVVHLLGGEGALGASVRRDVAALGFETRRHGGIDRYATAAAVARALPASTGAVLASGTAFPDALAASAPAAREGWPILLTAADHLPDTTADALALRQVTHLSLIGGGAAVSGAVEDHAAQTVATVTRLAGADRYATAAAVVEAFYPDPSGMSLASGADFPDALAGTRHAALLDQPLLLTAPAHLPPATADALRVRRPRRLDVYGGAAAVADDTAQQALHAAVDGPHSPRVTATSPAGGQTLADLAPVTVQVDRPVDPARSSVHVEVAGAEVTGALDATATGQTLTFRPHARAAAAYDTLWPGRVRVRAVAPDGTVGHHVVAFTYLEPDPVYATVGAISLHLPARDVDLIGFHQASHPGARHQSPRSTATPHMVLPTRDRGTGSHTAADVVVDPADPVLAPVAGRVVRAGSYPLYCRYHDDFVVIEPDERPGWEVKMLHLHGLQVGVGDRVEPTRTVIAAGARVLPFESQVDRYSTARWPHVHLEVIDPSIPPAPGGGC
ncbi:MAG: cell wall-binding repeat-containing protein [Egibacteraceae bacterium]